METATFDPAAFAARMDAVEMRLARLAERPLPDQLTEPDPGGEERWEATQVWAHVAELVPYWSTELRRIVDSESDEPVPFGRVATDAVRVDAIEDRRHWAQDDRWTAIRLALADLRAWVGALPPDAFGRTGLHPTGRVRTVADVLDRTIAAHLEEHATQLEGLEDRPSDAGVLS